MSATRLAAIMISFEDDENLKALGYEFSDEPIPAKSRNVARAQLKAYSGLKNSLLLGSSLLMRSPLVGRACKKLLASARAGQDDRYRQSS